jgi:hypothetical protein
MAFQTQEIGSWNVNDVGVLVQRLSGSSTQQLVVPEALSDYEGASGCVATWPVIYVDDGSRLVNDVTSFTDFYFTQLQVLRHRIANTETNGVRGKHMLPCLQMERDKILRVLNVDPGAGLDLAKSWMKDSSDRTLRMKAVRVLSDIGGEEAVVLLGTLTHDADATIAKAAEGVLRARGR